MLVLLQVVLILILAEWQKVLTTQAFVKSSLMRMTMVYEGNAILQHIEENANVASCQIAPTPLSSLLSLPFSEWASFACSEGDAKYRYYYYSEYLGQDSCAYIFAQPNQVADYFRTTLVLQKVGSPKEYVMLQSSVIKKVTATLPCLTRIHFVNVGRQMVREIS